MLADTRSPPRQVQLSFADAEAPGWMVRIGNVPLATSFITSYGSYCYVTMPFGLKNADTTYQRCMQRCFADQIDSPDQPDQVKRSKPTIAVYVDGVVVKTAQASDLIANLAATFMNL